MNRGVCKGCRRRRALTTEQLCIDCTKLKDIFFGVAALVDLLLDPEVLAAIERRSHVIADALREAAL